MVAYFKFQTCPEKKLLYYAIQTSNTMCKKVVGPDPVSAFLAEKATFGQIDRLIYQ